MKHLSSCALFLRIPLVVISLLLLWSCSTHEDESYTPIDGTESAMISFQLSSGGKPSTYGLNQHAENHIVEIDILLFDRVGLLSQLPTQGIVSMPDPATGGAQVTATLPIARYGHIILLANSSKMVAATLPSLAIGMSKDAVMQLLHMELAGKWLATEGSAGYIPIPMYGDTGEVNVNKATNNHFSASMLRMLVRVDLAVNIAGSEKFALNNIRVYNRNSVGMLAPSADVGKPNLPADPKMKSGPLLYDGVEISPPEVASYGEIYLFESAIVNPLDGEKRLDNATCLVVGGYYTPVGESANTTVESFYRIDFAQTDANHTKHYYDIIRNHQYKINIVSAWGPGEATPEEALDTELSRITVTVLDWNQGGEIGEDVDGQDILRVSPGIIDLPYTAHTTGSISNKVAVSSTHKGGWNVSKITEFDGTNEIETAGAGWLNTDLIIGDAQLADDMVNILLAENDAYVDRVGYIYISSGPRMSYKVKVTQREKPLFIGKIAWDDYDGTNSSGTNDGDTNLTSITIETTVGAAQTSTIANGVITPALELYGSIVEITATYKNYTLIIPPTEYLLIASTGLITVYDRTLIGKPVHLHKMRDGLKKSYIQVSDVNLADDPTYANWVPIGSNVPASLQFSGSYDGGAGANSDGAGFKIHNLNITKTTQYTGLFAYTNGGTFKNIHIVSGIIGGTTEVGAIFGSSNGGAVTGCSNAANVTGTANYVGGIAGSRSGGTMQGSTNTATIKGAGYVGGIAGRNQSGSAMKDCINTGNVSGTKDIVGGICGRNTSSNSDRASISGAVNSGKVTGSTNYVGGICGDNYSALGVITGCENLDGADINGAYYLGGIVGNNGGIISFSNNNAPVSGLDYIGGICGYSIVAATKITNCKNHSKGSVNGVNQVGGIAGEHFGTGSVDGCSNAATVEGDIFVGGLFGKSSSIISGLTCSNTGAVTGSDYVGNISGQSRGTISDFTNILPLSAVKNYAGGICGENRGTVKDCVNQASIEATENYVGGILGMNRGIVESCENAAMVSGRSYVGGIGGASQGVSTEITNCLNSVNGEVQGTGAKTGGIVGIINSGTTISKSSNYAPIRGGTGSYTGGICGDILAGQTVSGCFNAGTINGTAALGGIAGENSGTILGCANISDITATGQQVGGIAGNNYGAVSACYNIGGVSGAGDLYAVALNGTITSCYFGGSASNMPEITGTTLFGDGAPSGGWPTEFTPGWSTTDLDGYWGDLGGWSAGAGGTPAYPTLK